MKKVFVLGSYGCGNRGDDAILQSIVENLNSDTTEIYATSGKFEDIARWIPVKSIPCRLNEGFSIPVLISMCKSGLIMSLSILKSDMLIFGGGSLIHDLTPYNLLFMFLWHKIAKVFGKKVVYFCMGVGPIQTDKGKKLCKKYLSQADALFVRDQRGYDICQNLRIENVQMVKDSVFLLTEKNHCPSNPLNAMGLVKGEYVCVTASQWFDSVNFWNRNSIDFESQLKNFAECVRRLAQKTGKRVVFVPTVFHDAEIGVKIQNTLGKNTLIIVPAQYNSKEMAEIIENSYLLMGVRMHSMIFAAKQGVPFLPLIYDEKVSQLLQLLNMDKYSIKLSDATPSMVSEKLDSILENYANISDSLQREAAKFYDEDMYALRQVQNILNRVN